MIRAGAPWLLLFALAAGSARAQVPGDAERARAKQLTDEGTRQLDGGNAAGALSQFREAARVFPSPNVHFNIGLALARLGRPAEAADEFELFLDGAAAALEDARQFARAQVDGIDAKLSRLTVRCEPSPAQLTVDGAAQPCGRKLRLAPGRHALALKAAGRVPWRSEVILKTGEAMMLRPASAPEPGSAEPAVTLPVTRRPPSRIAPIAVGVGAVVTLAVGIGLRVSAQLDYNDLQHSCAPRCSPQEVDKRNIPPREYGGDALLAVFGVLVAVDVVLWILDARARRSPSPARALIEHRPAGLLVHF